MKNVNSDSFFVYRDFSSFFMLSFYRDVDDFWSYMRFFRWVSRSLCLSWDVWRRDWWLGGFWDFFVGDFWDFWNRDGD